MRTSSPPLTAASSAELIVPPDEAMLSKSFKSTAIRAAMEM
jgi:hypothetical protein